VVNIRVEPYDVYIGRPSVFGNPFRGPAAIRLFRAHLRSRPDLLAQATSLQGKRLGCWCKPKPCHGDVWARVAEGGQP
jgi:hypothetical protein